ncbi:hypothetical protein NM208_g2156 [Fusarium decemcellulare]|uniref:Uncharacterized protein n=1 Tax=Fusarium decemcellulare TaxID=57161 RepID=A0ACC1STS6_9HYPO|nr:hypothetical protein NM208_g2156 [Fusarium decemcellulare]
MTAIIVGVPGAWQPVECFAAVKEAFTARNYEFVGQTPPGVLVENPQDASAEKDAESLRNNLLLPLVKEGKDLVLMMHSYGGVYGSRAVQGLSKYEREQAGMKGGVVALIYVSAIPPMVGKTALEMMGANAENLPDWVEYDESTGFVKFSGARDIMYHDVPEDDVTHYMSLLRNQSLNSINTPVSYSPLDDPNFDGAAGYVLCGADRIIPLSAQETYAAIGKMDRKVLVEKASHAFFAIAPTETVDAVIELLQG